MTESKAWNWNIADKSRWINPSIEYYFYAATWKNKGYDNILDLGCGLGRHTLAFAKDRYNVSACDLSCEAVAATAQLLADNNVTINSLDCCDMLNLPYDDNSMDAIFSYHVISHTDTEGMNRILSEIKRVLRPNGEILIDFISKESVIYRTAKTFLDSNTIKMEVIKEEYGIPHFFIDKSDVPALLADYELVKVYEKRVIQYDENRNCNSDSCFNTHIYVNARLIK